MTLARLGTTSLFLGVWTPLVALAIVWAAAGTGTPIVFALEQAGVEQIDRTAVALVFAPPLPYLLALAALAIGLAAQHYASGSLKVVQIRRAALRLWFGAGLVLCTAAPLGLYAEHGTAHEPADGVHLSMLIATWVWWSMTATAITVAIVIRTHVALAMWASRSRAVAGTSLGLGVLSLSVASVAVAPRPARAALGEWMPAVEELSTNTESLVLALAGGSTSLGANNTGDATGTEAGDDGGDVYDPAECLENLPDIASDAGLWRLQAKSPSVDVFDIALGVAIEICEKRPRRGDLGGLVYTATTRRVASQLGSNATARRREYDVAGLMWNRPDPFAQREAEDVVDCVMRGLRQKDQRFIQAMLLEQDVDEVALRLGMSRGAVEKATSRAKKSAKVIARICLGDLP